MKNYCDQYLRVEDIDWKWSFDSKTKTHTLTLTHLPSTKSATGGIREARENFKSLSQRKRDLYQQLTDKLESLVFENGTEK